MRNDPRWIIAKYAGTDQDGRAIKRGDRVFYYPLTRAMLTGEKAEQAAREFQAAASDEGYFP